ERVTCPVRYVLATGESYGSKDGEQDGARAALESVLARNPNLKVSAKVASNHGAILRKDYRAVADAIREIVAAGDRTAAG
ncbi:MAG TPA: alpha/beta hydrolase, partial [Pseudonocardia sp.]|nr:alpha/beta hydrolase [Pseudonocardia sp.]